MLSGRIISRRSQFRPGILRSSGGAGSPPPLGQALSYAVLACPVMQPTSRVTRATSFGSGTVRAPGLSHAATLSVSPTSPPTRSRVIRRPITFARRRTALNAVRAQSARAPRTSDRQARSIFASLYRRRWRAGASLSARGAFVLSRHAACRRHVSLRSFRARHADLGWANLAEGRLRLDRLPATAAGRLSSPAGPPRGRGPRPTAFLAQGKKVSGLPSSAALRPFGLSLGCGSIAPGR